MKTKDSGELSANLPVLTLDDLQRLCDELDGALRRTIFCGAGVLALLALCFLLWWFSFPA